MRDRYDEALDAARQCQSEGSIDKIHTRRDEYGFRSILAHSEDGWYTWFNEAEWYEYVGGSSD